MTTRRGPAGVSLTDHPVSLTYGKYDDVRMPWVGRFGTPRQVAITDAWAQVVGSNESRVWLLLTNDGVNTVYLDFGEATSNTARINANGGTLMLDKLSPWPYTISARCNAGLTSTLLVHEVSQNVIDGRGE